jgi:hypothetical protein
MASKSSDIVTEIAAAVPKRQPQRWHRRVSAEHAATLDAIREAYVAGKFGSAKRPAHIAIAAVLASRGIANVGRNGVQAWLENQ